MDTCNENGHPIPPDLLQDLSGSGDFAVIGSNLVQKCIELGGLQPQHRILDVGCGAGRLAIPLGTFINERGAYDGFDIIKESVEWCKTNIAVRGKTMRFTHVDVFNGTYNPTGKIKPLDFSFPYDDASFDFIILNSVFTHMMPEETARYLQELHRVLAPGGVAFITHFIITEQRAEIIKYSESETIVRFPFRFGKCWVKSDANPENAVAYDHDFLVLLYQRAHMDIDRIVWGDWCDPETQTARQDIILARKRE